MTEFSKLNYINVGPKGTFKPSGDLFTTPNDIDAIFEHLIATDAKKLVVHFHGGLISESSGETIARSMYDLYKSDAHPITFIWETGLVETVTRNLTTLTGTKLFQKVLKYAIRRAASRLGGGIGGKGAGEVMSMGEVEEELQRAHAFDRFDEGARGAASVMDEAELDAIEPEILVEVEIDLESDPEIEDILSTEPQSTELLDPEFKKEIADADQKGLLGAAKLALRIAKVVYLVIKRFIRKRDHGFYPTVVEETLRELYLADLGEWVWGSMKDVADAMWFENSAVLNNDSHPGRYFLEELATHQEANPAFTVDLVGHSAGSIAICNMQRSRRSDFPQLAIRNISFLAPACTQHLFKQEIVDHPEDFQLFRMFTMHDDLETDDELLKLVYTRSLLYFISGVLEDEPDKLIAGIELHMRGEEPYDDPDNQKVREFVVKPGENRLVLSKTTDEGPGLNSAADTHGGFDDDPVTRKSLIELLTA